MAEFIGLYLLGGFLTAVYAAAVLDVDDEDCVGMALLWPLVLLTRCLLALATMGRWLRRHTNDDAR